MEEWKVENCVKFHHSIYICIGYTLCSKYQSTFGIKWYHCFFLYDYV